MFFKYFLQSFKISGENRKLVSNTFYLYILQGVNYVVPLLTIPYLVRVLGTEVFGILAFYGAFITYFQLVVDYGFNLSATRIVSVNKNNKVRLSQLFFNVLSVKIILATVCFAGLLLLLLTVPRIHSEQQLCFWLFFGVVGSILFPSWFYQGMEDMRYITIFNMISKIAVSLMYFIMIKSPRDYLWFAYLNVAGTWIIGFVAFFVALRKYSLKPLFSRPKDCIDLLKNGFNIFVSQISVSLFTNTNIFLLGIFTNNQVVGKYAIAEKIVRAGMFLAAPVSNAIYPRTAALFHESRERAIRFLRVVVIVGASIFGLLSLFMFIGADIIVTLISGTSSNEIALLVRIMSLLPLSVFLDNIFGTQILLNINLQKQFMRIILSCGVFSVLLLVILVPPLKAIGSATSFLVSEITLMVLMVAAVRKAGIALLKKP